MPKDQRLPSQPKASYRVTNWPEYNAGLIERGNVSIWMDQEMFAPTAGAPVQRGRPQAYCDAVIQMLLALKSVYRLPLRALQGFAMSLAPPGAAGLASAQLQHAEPKGQGAAGELGRCCAMRARRCICWWTARG